jgi:alpha-mannosidase
MNPLVETLQTLRQLTQVSLQQGWHITPVLADQDVSALTENCQNWPIADLNAKDHIAWDKGQTRILLVQEIQVPAHLHDYETRGLKLYLALTWWAEKAEIWVDGALAQVGDLFDCSTRILLTEAAEPGTIYRVILDLVSPGHDPGALVRSQLMFESPDDQTFLEPGFIADEFQGLHTYLQAFQPDDVPQLEATLATLDWQLVRDRDQFQHHLAQLRSQLQPLATNLHQRHIHLVGHAHLDLAWLWPIPETWDAAERTFKSVLGLQTEFSELIFCHSSPALFEWLEHNRPDLFQAIQDQVAAGTFEIVAGLWVEPELNLIDGESIVRQILYGQLYTQAKFGALNRVAWVPDTFGFCWQLPQLLRQGEIDYFVTQKLRWNDTTQFPYDAFWWRSPDGTAIFSLMTGLIGQAIDPIKMTDYVCEWQQKTLIPDSLWLPGVGDHGGGPTKDMLQTARRWQRSPFFPQMQFSTVLEYLQTLQPNPGDDVTNTSTGKHDLPRGGFSEGLAAELQGTLAKPAPTEPAVGYPVWDSELYLEFHRGCYTTHADQKRYNRQSEILLYQAELFSSLASLLTGCDYPQVNLTTAWKGLLFNQFHDILPGSSIADVYEDANQIWQTVISTGKTVLAIALQTLAQQIQLPPPPVEGATAIAVFNPLHWARTEVVAIANPDDQAYTVLDSAGQLVVCQTQRVKGTSVIGSQTLFEVTALPGLGYQVYWLCPTQAPPETPVPTHYVLDNQNLRINLDPLTGDIASLFDKVSQREVLCEPGNQLQCFADEGQYWDAWNIDPNYAQHPLPAPQLESITWVESGPLRQRIRVVRIFQSSRFQQDYVLDTNSSHLTIETTVDWQERHVLVKAVFRLNVEDDSVATYETPFAAIARPNRPQTPAEKAMWEVPALRWADLGNADYGVSLLNDCKYGYDCQGNQLRLTLLRGSVWPNPEADLGLHQFTYAIYPHRDRWNAAQVVQHGYRLNQPPLVQSADGGRHAPTLPTTGQFLNPWPENVVLSAWKRSEADPNGWVLRCYEAHGQAADVTIRSSQLSFAPPQTANLLEKGSESIGSNGVDHQSIPIQPWQVCTVLLAGS